MPVSYLGQWSRRWRGRLGLPQGDVGLQTLVSQLETGKVESLGYERDRRLRLVIVRRWSELKGGSARERRRRSWRAQWLDSLSVGSFMRAAAAFLDWGGDSELADMLLAAKPGYVTDVATFVVPHALARIPTYEEEGGPKHAWDILAEAGLVEKEIADEAYFAVAEGRYPGLSASDHWFLDPVPTCR